MKQTFWIYNPLILIDKNYAKEIFPLNEMTENQKLNALSRLIIMLSILNYIITKSNYTIISGVIALILIVAYHKNREGFENNDTDEILGESIYENNVSENCKPVSPTTENPMMNVLLTDITDNPTRCSAEPSYTKDGLNKINESVKSGAIANVQDERLFKSTDDEMQFDYSMRNFYTTPNTEIPNAQTKFAEWCYGDMPSRKDGTSLEQN